MVHFVNYKTEFITVKKKDDFLIFKINKSSCGCTELVVAESVVVIKKLLQMQPEKHSDIIKHMAKLTDNIQVRVNSQTAVNVLNFVFLGFDLRLCPVPVDNADKHKHLIKL